MGPETTLLAAKLEDKGAGIVRPHLVGRSTRNVISVRYSSESAEATQLLRSGVRLNRARNSSMVNCSGMGPSVFATSPSPHFVAVHPIEETTLDFEDEVDTGCE